MSLQIMPERIKLARESRGYSQAELAELINVSKQMISLYEKGTHMPQGEALLKIIEELKFPISYYNKPIVFHNNNNPTFFRKRKSTTKKVEKAARHMVDTIWEIDDYIKEWIDYPNVNKELFKYKFEKEPIGYEKIEEVALEVRDLFNLGIGPIYNLTSVLQENGCVIAKIKVRSRQIDAFSRLDSHGTPYIFVNSSNQSAVRLRFDLAHELGHLVLHSTYCDDDLKDVDSYNLIEEEANYFAAAFLLPRDSFSKDVYSSSLNHFLLLKKKWRVSMGCMIYRCSDLNLLTTNQITYLKNQMTQKRYWRHEPYDDVWEMDKPFLHKQAIKLIIDNNIVPFHDMINNMLLSPKELEETFFLDDGMLSNNSQPNIIFLK